MRKLANSLGNVSNSAAPAAGTASTPGNTTTAATNKLTFGNPQPQPESMHIGAPVIGSMGADRRQFTFKPVTPITPIPLTKTAGMRRFLKSLFA